MSYINITEDIRVNSDFKDFGLKIGNSWYSVRKLIESTMWIIDKKRESRLIKLNYAQEKLFFEICKCLGERRACNFIILKARQLGFTTFISAFLFIMTFFRANQDSVIIANTTDNASKIFTKYRYYYDMLKANVPSLAPVLQNKTGNQIVSKNTHSSIRIAPATQDAVRGTTITGFHGSECAFRDNIEDILLASKSAIPSSSINPITFFFLESTANGENAFKDYWDIANENVGEEGAYIPMFFPWYENSEYKEYYNGFVLTPYEKEQKEKYNLSNEQIAFFRKQYLGFGKNLQKTLQEYPFCPSDAFSSSGNGVFDNMAIQKAKDTARFNKATIGFFDYNIETISIDDFKMKDLKFIESNAGHIKIHELPLKGVPYCIGVDMAVGLGNDSSVAVVIRNDTKRVVAIMESNSIPQEKYSLDVVALGRFYNNALVCPETAYGGTCVSYLKKFNYQNIFKRTNEETSVSENYLSVYGFKTTFTSKQSAINLTREICSEETIPYSNVVDYGILCQMESFVYEYGNSNDSTKVKMKGAGAKHDDRVMALAIAYYSTTQQDTSVYIEKENKESQLPWQLQSEETEKVESIWEEQYI